MSSSYSVTPKKASKTAKAQFLLIFYDGRPSCTIEGPADLLKWTYGRRKGFLDRTPEAKGYNEITKMYDL